MPLCLEEDLPANLVSPLLQRAIVLGASHLVPALGQTCEFVMEDLG